MDIPVALSQPALAALTDLISNRAGRTPSEVFEKLLLTILPEFRAQHVRLAELSSQLSHCQNELTSLNTQIAQLQQVNQALQANQSLQAAADADEDDGAAPVRKHFFKSIYDLDPSGGYM